MLILEKSVTKIHWHYVYRKLFRKIQKGDYVRVGSSGVLLLTFGSRHRYYVLTCREGKTIRPVSWLYLWQKPDWQAWEVMQVFTIEPFRGKGLAKKLYSAAVNSDDLILASGKTQSKSSRGLWSSFIKNNNFSIYAIDYWDLNDRCQVLWVDCEIWCELEIYFRVSKGFQDRDVRLIATRKT